MDSSSDNIEILLVGNKIDLSSKRQVSSWNHKMCLINLNDVKYIDFIVVSCVSVK